MGFVELEQVGKKILEQLPVIKRLLKRVYQLASVATSNERFKSEGDVVKVSPVDEYEYFYGYYDKSPWDATDRYMLCLKVKQTYKSVTPKEPGVLGVIDTMDGNKFEKIGITHSWNVQQGCMAQWIGPDFSNRILYNDFRDGHYCAVIYDFQKRKEEKILPMAAYDVASDGSFILSLDFSRLHRMRPGYGYSNLPDTTKGIRCPDQGCIWKVDIETGKVSELFKYTDFATFEPEQSMVGAEHKVNHLMISPNCKRFMVLYRWFQKGHKHSRLVTVNVDRSEMYNLSDDVFVSHCYWKNDDEILSFLRKKETGDHYYLMRDKTQEYKLYWPELNTDGHCSYSPDGKFIITDTYPNRKRIASIFLCTEEDNRSRRVARVISPFRYDNDCRCDLHPRWNRFGTSICFDSVHEGKRALYTTSIKKNKDGIVFYNDLDMGDIGEPLVSFIIPVFNAENTIERCMKSILLQSCDSWEIVVVNDGSTDNTNEKLNAFRDDNRVRIVNQENGGPGRARNVGVRNAKGIYISFLDADDYIENKYVTNLKEIALHTNADVIFYETTYEDEKGRPIKTSKIYKYAQEERDSFITTQLSGRFSWGACKAIKRKLIVESCAEFSTYDVGEEALFTFKILVNAKRIEFLKVPLYHYVQSNTGQHKKGNEDPIKKAVCELNQYLIDYNLLERYEVALNNMALKALSMSLYRCSLKYNFFEARRHMKDKVEFYCLNYNFNKIDKSKLNNSAKAILPFVKKKMFIPIFVASRLKNGGIG